eukprot:m.264744 g.264744  ORF g.264744 m.264744 type:complete len:331 (-) comp58006_c0_seq1:29-1021(-)
MDARLSKLEFDTAVLLESVTSLAPKIAAVTAQTYALAIIPAQRDGKHTEQQRNVGDGGEMQLIDLGPSAPDAQLRRLRKAETVLTRRSGKIIVVLEGVYDQQNVTAILRSCDCLGVQHVWIVDPITFKNEDSHSVQYDQWLTVRRFQTTEHCVSALRHLGYAIWVTELGQRSECLDPAWKAQCPDGGVAVVFGRETDGVSETMIAAADKLVYFPLDGFTESLNVSVAAALVLSTLFRQCQGLKTQGLSDAELLSLRTLWYTSLARTTTQLRQYTLAITSPPPPWVDLRWPEDLRSSANNVPPKIRKRELLKAKEQGVAPRQWRAHTALDS